MRMRVLMLLAAVALLAGGCAGVSINPAIHDMKELLASPAVQATIQTWNADGDASNPSIAFECYSGGRVRFDGVIMRMRATGDRAGGLDPELLRVLTEIAKAAGYHAPPPSASTQPAATQPALDPVR